MEAGHLCLVNYGERPVTWHSRLLLAPIEGNLWQICTPDMDRYPELLEAANPDYTDFVYLGANPAVPARISARSVYGFQPMGPGQLAQLIQQGRIEADAERAARGLGPLGPGGVLPAAAGPPAAPAAPGPAAVAPVVVGGAPAAVAAAPAPAVAVMVWVAIEAAGGYSKGEIVVVEPTPLPLGHHIIGDRCILPSKLMDGQGCFARRVLQSEAANYQLDDFRVLPVKFDAQGLRRCEFNLAVAAMKEGVPQGGGLQLDGPASALNILKNMRDQNFTPTTFHEFWLRSSDIPRGDRSTYEHECLSRILEALVTVDQVNVASMQGVELIVRRMQVIREAHRVCPTAPDYSSADYFMGWRWRKGAQGIDSALAAHVAAELKNDAAISKEARKAKEEQQARRRGPGKQGGGGEQK